MTKLKDIISRNYTGIKEEFYSIFNLQETAISMLVESAFKKDPGCLSNLTKFFYDANTLATGMQMD